MLALLGEPGVVDDQEPVAAEPAADPGVEVVEHLLLVPRALVEELLEGLLVVLVPLLDGLEPGGHRLDALAVAVEEDPPEVGVAPVPPPRVPEGAGHLVEERGQVLPQLGQLPCVHELILPKTNGTARSRNGVIPSGGGFIKS